MSTLQQNWRKGQNRLPGIKGHGREREAVRGRERRLGTRGEMAQTMYAHMNK
jgi:hypothetical protein